LSPEVVVTAALTARTERVFLAVDAVSAVTSAAIQFSVKVAAIRQTVAVTWFALVRISSCRPLPRLVVVERQALATVWSRRVVLALAHEALLQILPRRLDTVAGVTVTLAPAADSKV